MTLERSELRDENRRQKLPVVWLGGTKLCQRGIWDYSHLQVSEVTRTIILKRRCKCDHDETKIKLYGGQVNVGCSWICETRKDKLLRISKCKRYTIHQCSCKTMRTNLNNSCLEAKNRVQPHNLNTVISCSILLKFPANL